MWPVCEPHNNPLATMSPHAGFGGSRPAAPAAHPRRHPNHSTTSMDVRRMCRCAGPQSLLFGAYRRCRRRRRPGIIPLQPTNTETYIEKSNHPTAVWRNCPQNWCRVAH